MRTNKRNRDSCVTATSSTLGGGFVYPEYNLIVGTSFTAFDALGLGKEDDYLDAIIHFVLDENDTITLKANGVFPLTEVPPMWETQTKTISVVLPHMKVKKK